MKFRNIFLCGVHGLGLMVYMTAHRVTPLCIKIQK
jgi:hypothetical protein